MKTAPFFAVALLLAPIYAAAAIGDDPAEKKSESVAAAAPAEAKEDTKAGSKVENAAEEKVAAETKPAVERRICRYIRADMSSRRKTKVCRTKDEWRALNQQR